jgi:hypothetical protein
VRDLAAEFAQGLVTGLANLSKRYNRFYLPLTAGLDSRTVLAATIAAGIEPITYTFDRPTISHADRSLPPALAAAVNLKHHLIGRGSFDRARYDQFDDHSYGQCVGTDREYFSCGQWAWAQDGLILRGGCFEFGRGYYYEKLSNDFDIEDSDAAMWLHSTFGRLLSRSQPRVREGFELWLKWVSQNVQSGLDFRDRLYLEQRIGCWLSTIEQALDLTGTERLHIANSQRSYSLLNQLPLTERKHGSLQQQIIKRLAPNLAEFSFNTPDPKWLQRRNRLVNLPRKISALMSSLRH